MARKLNNAQLWNALGTVGVMREKTSTHGSSTLDGAHAAAAATITVIAATNFGDGDLIRIGSGNTMEVHAQVGAPAGQVLTLQNPLEYAHASGEVVVELAKTVLGDTDDDGVSSDAEGDFAAVYGATRRMVLAFRGGHHAPTISFNLREFALENLAFALGMTEASILGAGSAVDPYRLVQNPEKFGLALDQIVYFTGVLHDTVTNLEVRGWGCEVDWSKAGKHTFKRGDAGGAVVPVVLRPTSAIEYLLW